MASPTPRSRCDERHAHAAQLWIALPYEQRDIAPAFDHHPDLPRWQEQGVTFTLLAGALAGRQAPCRLYSPLLGADLACHDASTLQLTLDRTSSTACCRWKAGWKWAASISR